ncbi:glutamate--tRNA ligase [Candidatus Falkowbacteria bacterium HGW-Falkowbacteria-2]|uniref:Glutamate--tRNA ligase n=1 Tax=Candidatus Falkowbacteria bacterium HGW-Falkowbacteria-2 TaxID=2013769 RepID=A0A2N2E301_9BACT|nr:MAG: glutamate--tRNA ligase [Candidatus Falkowbacteria bacterium HGW-Falkowbacteria-2]
MNTDKHNLINRLFPNPLPTPEELEKRYPRRNLPEKAMVTRVAPSPTGSVHFGSIYASLISERLAHQSDGLFILRIEDTDKKREIAGTADLFAATLERYNIIADEGPDKSGHEIGEYGPYKQSERAAIYHSYIKHLLESDKAYPCFATPEELEELRARQEAMGERSGYYGHFALWREKSVADAISALDQGLKPVIRLKSPGNFQTKIMVDDLLIGRREMPENDQDIIIMKADGLPTYHFAHAVDDYLMRTTHVIRGNEWFPSLPLHLQLFAVLGWTPPAYAHLAPIQKMEDGKKRKLSKRKDPEANIEYYRQAGYLEEAIIEYLLNLANSNFEDWRRANPVADYREFILTLKKLANSNGPLFDLAKLNDISKDIISRLDAKTVAERALAWAKEYDEELYELMNKDRDYTEAIFNIERSGVPKPRKDIGRFEEVRQEISYFFDDLFTLSDEDLRSAIADLNGAEPKALVADFMAIYDEKDGPEEWFEKFKEAAAKHGFAKSPNEYKSDPEKHRGQAGTAAKLLRILLTGRTQTPNLCYVMKVMGKERVKRRLERI